MFNLPMPTLMVAQYSQLNVMVNMVILPLLYNCHNFKNSQLEVNCTPECYDIMEWCFPLQYSFTIPCLNWAGWFERLFTLHSEKGKIEAIAKNNWISVVYLRWLLVVKSFLWFLTEPAVQQPSLIILIVILLVAAFPGTQWLGA